MRKISLFILIVCLHANAKPVKKNKTTVRKPNQIQENYFRCEFQRMNERLSLFKISMRNPVFEDEMTYKESNRQQALLVKLTKSGQVYFRLLNERSKEVIATGSETVDFNQSFSVSGPDSEGVWQLNCAI